MHVIYIDVGCYWCLQILGKSCSFCLPYIHYVICLFVISITGQLRLLEFQGNVENTSSFPKFEIANYDITRICVHEQKRVHFRLITHSSFCKISIATKTFVSLCTTRTFYPQISGSDYGRVSTTDKVFGPFSEWDFSPKKTFSRHVFSSLNVNKENPVEFLPTYAIGAFTYSPLY